MRRMRAAAHSVVKVRTVAPACQNVAGGERVSVSVDGQDHSATVVSFDSATTGADAVILGYPMGGAIVATPARIREVIEVTGPDTYHATTVTREVYVIRGTVRQGNTGGPLIGPDGRVLGIPFGAKVDDLDTGFALTAGQIAAQATTDGSQPVATGACVS